MNVRMLTHIGLCVADLGRARSFYTDVEAIYLERDGFRLELLHYRSPGHQGEAHPRPMNLLGFTHLSLRVADLDGIGAQIEAPGDPSAIPQGAPRT